MMERAQELPVGWRLFSVRFVPEVVRTYGRPAGKYPFVLAPLVAFGPLYLPFGRRFKAECEFGLLEQHIIQSVDPMATVFHGCGFYGLWDVKNLCEEFSFLITCRDSKPVSVKAPWRVLAGVRPFGTVLRGPEGFRASDMQLEWFINMPAEYEEKYIAYVGLGQLVAPHRSKFRRLKRAMNILEQIGIMLFVEDVEIAETRAKELLKRHGFSDIVVEIEKPPRLWAAPRELLDSNTEYILSIASIDDGMWMVVTEGIGPTIVFEVYITYKRMLRILSYNYSTPIVSKPETWG